MYFRLTLYNIVLITKATSTLHCIPTKRERSMFQGSHLPPTPGSFSQSINPLPPSCLLCLPGADLKAKCHFRLLIVMLSGSQQPHAYVYLQGLAEGGSAVISGVQGPKRFNTPVFCVVLCSGGQAALQAQLLLALSAHSQPSPALWRRKLTAWVNSPSDVPVSVLALTLKGEVLSLRQMIWVCGENEELV